MNRDCLKGSPGTIVVHIPYDFRKVDPDSSHVLLCLYILVVALIEDGVHWA